MSRHRASARKGKAHKGFAEEHFIEVSKFRFRIF